MSKHTDNNAIALIALQRAYVLINGLKEARINPTRATDTSVTGYGLTIQREVK